MYCQNRITHKIVEGDSLYKLAREYDTTVTELILLNTGVNPYNLQIGMRLTICPGERYVNANMDGATSQSGAAGQGSQTTTGGQMPSQNQTMPGNQMMPTMPQTPMQPGNQMTPTQPGTQMPPQTPTMPQTPARPGMSEEEEMQNFRDDMRFAWQNHVIWTKIYLISAASDLPYASEALNQLEDNVEEIADLFSGYYSPAAIRQLRTLLMEHIRMAGDLIKAKKEKNTAEYDRILPDWYENAERITGFFAAQTPAYNRQELQDMWKNHLDLLREEIEDWFDGDYEGVAEAFMESQDEILSMADYLVMGLMAR